MHHFFLRKTLCENNTEFRNEGLGNMISTLGYKEDTSRLDMYINMKYGLFAIMDRQANVLNGKSPRNKNKSDKREFDPTLSPTEASLQLLRIFTKNQREYNDSSSSPFKFGESKNELNNFSIQHYWGEVSYKIGDFVEKNVDSLSTDFIILFRGDNKLNVKGSSNGFVAGLFNDKSLIIEDDQNFQGSLANARSM